MFSYNNVIKLGFSHFLLSETNNLKHDDKQNSTLQKLYWYTNFALSLEPSLAIRTTYFFNKMFASRPPLLTNSSCT